MDHLWQLDSELRRCAQPHANVAANRRASARLNLTCLGFGGNCHAEPNEYLSDGVHPTADGYELMARNFSRVVMSRIKL